MKTVNQVMQEILNELNIQIEAAKEQQTAIAKEIDLLNTKLETVREYRNKLMDIRDEAKRAVQETNKET